MSPEIAPMLIPGQPLYCRGVDETKTVFMIVTMYFRQIKGNLITVTCVPKSHPTDHYHMMRVDSLFLTKAEIGKRDISSLKDFHSLQHDKKRQA